MDVRNRIAIAVTAAAAVALGVAPVRAADAVPTWRATWGAAPQPAVEADGAVRVAFPSGSPDEQTVRLVVRTSVGGDAVRLRLSNAYGRRPVRFRAVTVAHAAGGAAVHGTTLRPVTFAGGHRSVVLAPGAEIRSDRVALAVGPLRDLAVSIAVASRPGRPTWHATANRVSWVSSPGSGDRTADVSGTGFTGAATGWFWLTGVDVDAARERGTVVALGDSITDGAMQLPERHSAWPSVLAARLAASASPGEVSRGVVNEGIGGNMVTRDCGGGCGTAAVRRAARDVLAQAGATHLVLLAGSNDVVRDVEANRIVAGLRSIAASARRRGLVVVGATIPPRADVAWRAADHEPVRTAVNSWIRGATDVFDAVADVDVAVRDPLGAHRLDPRYDSGDGAHPNAAGHEVVAGVVGRALGAAGGPRG